MFVRIDHSGPTAKPRGWPDRSRGGEVRLADRVWTHAKQLWRSGCIRSLRWPRGTATASFGAHW